MDAKLLHSPIHSLIPISLDGVASGSGLSAGEAAVKSINACLASSEFMVQ